MRQPRKRGEAERRPAGIAARQRMLDGIPVRARRLDVDGVSTSVLDAGSGPPLVLLHGGIETGGAYWAPVISRLAENHRLVVPDVPRLGESEPVARLDLPTFDAWFTTLLAQTCEEKPVVVAHSLLGTMTVTERLGWILAAYRTLTDSAPRELTTFLILLEAPPAPFVPVEWQGKKTCAMAVCYSGDLDQVDTALAPIRALGDPVIDLIQEMPYTDVQSYLDDTDPKGNHYYWKTEFVADLSDDLLAGIRDQFSQCPIPGAELGFLHLGGALNEHDPDDGAVGNRDARFAFGVNGMCEPDEPNAADYRQCLTSARRS